MENILFLIILFVILTLLWADDRIKTPNMIKKILVKIKKYYIKGCEAECVCYNCGREIKRTNNHCPECGHTQKDYCLKIRGESYNIKRVSITIFVLLIIILAFIFNANSINLFSKDVLFWSFSAILQAFSGLIAFFAAVIIFRIQINSLELGSIADRLRQTLPYFLNNEPYSHSLNWLLNASKDITPESHPASKNEAQNVQNLYQRAIVLQKSTESIKKDLKESFLINLIVIISALIFLVTTEYIYKYHFDIVAIIWIVVFCIASLLSAKKLLVLIR